MEVRKDRIPNWSQYLTHIYKVDWYLFESFRIVTLQTIHLFFRAMIFWKRLNKRTSLWSISLTQFCNRKWKRILQDLAEVNSGKTEHFFATQQSRWKEWTNYIPWQSQHLMDSCNGRWQRKQHLSLYRLLCSSVTCWDLGCVLTLCLRRTITRLDPWLWLDSYETNPR